MKIDYDQPIKNLAGVPYKIEEKPLTLGDVCAEALATDSSGGKMKLFSLAQKAHKGGQSEIDAADLSLTKTAVESCKSYQGNAVILGQALELLEQVK